MPTGLAADLRYFLDTEFNGFGGELISLALVPEFGDQDFYCILPLPDDIHPWVARHVIPFLRSAVPETVVSMVAPEQAAHEIAAYLSDDAEPEIMADWPDDIAYFCKLLMTGPGRVVATPNLHFQYLHTPGFSTAMNSRVPHNALHDARALRAFVLG